MKSARALCHGNVFCNYNFLKIHTFPQAKPSAVIQLTFVDIGGGGGKPSNMKIIFSNKIILLQTPLLL